MYFSYGLIHYSDTSMLDEVVKQKIKERIHSKPSFIMIDVAWDFG